MTSLTRLLITTLWLTTPVVPVSGQERAEPPLPATALRNLAYVARPHTRQKLDLFLPEGDMRRPLAVYIHGGGLAAKLLGEAADERQ